MQASTPVIRVHSVAEAYLFVMVRQCPACGDGPVRSTNELTRISSASDGWALDVACAACRHADNLRFEIDPQPTRAEAATSRINPTDHRSEAIDLLGWLTLYRSIVASAQKETDPQSARRLALEAAQCLDEALKFYTPDNELPGLDAFVTEAARNRFRDHPQQF